MKPNVFLLCGLPGTGKTTYAKNLEKDGAIRLTLDEELFSLHGRNLPEGTYPDAERKTKEVLTDRLVTYLKESKSIILDWGFWKKEERNRIANLVREHSGEPKLLYFNGNSIDLVNRVQDRDLAKNHEIDAAMLADFQKRFEEPHGEGEIVV